MHQQIDPKTVTGIRFPSHAQGRASTDRDFWRILR
jgi:hypothetical protein